MYVYTEFSYRAQDFICFPHLWLVKENTFSFKMCKRLKVVAPQKDELQKNPLVFFFFESAYFVGMVITYLDNLIILIYSW